MKFQDQIRAEQPRKVVMAGRTALCIIILTVTALFVNGQTSSLPEPTPTPFLGRSETGLEATRRLDREHSRLEQQTYSNLHGQGAYANSPRFSRKFRSKMVSLYRKPRKTETKILEPDEKFRREYSKLLQEKKTGLFKLIPDQGCESGTKVIRASANCLKYDFPGAGSSYSFRQNSYRIRRLTDITLVKNSLIARGVLSGAIFVELDDVPIEKVDLNTRGLSFLARYSPVKSVKDALEEARRFAKGVKKDGYIYGRGVYASKDNTFAMRSIAYRGKYILSESGVTYNELDFDKRRDIIVVFRVVNVEDDGSVTIVWKVLRDTKSPKLKISRETR